MRDNIAKVGATHVAEMRNVHRDLLEKAMHMRCISYLSDAKSRLLIRTVAAVGHSKRTMADAHGLLEQSLARTRAEIEARKALERELCQITDVVDRAPIMLAICSDGVVRYSNEAFAEIFGGGEKPVGSRAEVLAARATGGPDTPLAAAVRARRPWLGEAELRTARGQLIWGRVRLSLLPGGLPGGAAEEPRMVVFIEDVTKEREAELRLQRAQRVEALGQLTGGIVHDFNNLLMVIAANAELCAAGGAEAPGAAAAILDAAARGASLTRQLLASARRNVLKPEPVDVNALLGRLGEMLARTFGERFTVRAVPAHEPCVALCDPGLLESAIVNLALNARDAADPSGTVSLAASAFRAPSDTVVGACALAAGEYVRVAVSDDGCGVPAELRERIWEPFFSTKGSAQNSGLGLSTVLGFAQQSAGAVELEPAPGRGTTFVLYLPRAAPASKPVSSAPPRRGRILLVEDDPTVQGGLCRLLSRLRFEVVAVRGLDDAVAELDSGKPFGLLLTDVVLRGSESGITVAAEARRRYPEMPVIFMSGYSHDVLAGVPALPGGRTEFLQKPFFKADLERAMDVVSRPEQAG